MTGTHFFFLRQVISLVLCKKFTCFSQNLSHSIKTGNHIKSSGTAVTLGKGYGVGSPYVSVARIPPEWRVVRV